MSTYNFGGSSGSMGSPQYNAAGLIVGYSGLTANKKPAVSSAQIPVRDANGLIIGYHTGTETAADAATNPVNPTPAPTDPNSQFSLLHQSKNPQIAAATSGLVTASTNTAAQENKTFSDYLKEANDQNAQNKTQLTTDRNTYSTAAPQLDARLSALEKQLAGNLGTTNDQIIAANKTYADQQAGVIKDLGTQDQAYADTVNAVAGQAVDSATMGNKLYQAAGGTPTSDSGDMRNRAISAYLSANIPAQREIAGMKIGQLTNFVAPTYGAERANTVGQLQGFQAPMYSQLTSMGMSDAQIVTQLRTSLAGRSVQESQAYLQQLGVPIGLQQQILSGQIGSLGQLSGLDQSNTFYGLASPYTSPGYNLPAYSGGGVGYPQVAPRGSGMLTAPGGTTVTVGGTPLNGAVSPTNPLGLPTDKNTWTTADYAKYNAAASALVPRQQPALTPTTGYDPYGRFE